jgi:16S rRNA (guanine527-N7)-methyltransferase
VDELELGNAQFNLTAIRDRPGNAAQARARQSEPAALSARQRLADVGTGAGFRGCRWPSSIPSAASPSSRPPAKRLDSWSKPRSGWGAAMFKSCTRARKAIGRSNFSIQWWRGLCPRWPISWPMPGHLCAPGRPAAGDEGQAARRGDFRPAQSFRVLAVHRLKLPGLDDERHLVELHLPSPVRPGGPAKSESHHEAGHRSCKSKRRSGQDHDRRQSGRLADGDQAPRAADRSGSPGQCHHGMRHRQARPIAHQLRCAAGRLRAMEALVPVEYGGFMLMPPIRISPRPKCAAHHDGGTRIQIAQCAESRCARFRRDPDRLPALAQHADLERAGGGGFGHGTDAMRVLRLGGLERVDADHRADPRQHQSGLEIEGLLRTMFDPRNNLATKYPRSSSSISATRCSAP